MRHFLCIAFVIALAILAAPAQGSRAYGS